MQEIFLEQQEEVAEVVTSEEYQNTLQSLAQLQETVAEAFGHIDLSGVNQSNVEAVATSDFVTEKTETAEKDLRNEISVEDGELSEEDTQRIWERATDIAESASNRENRSLEKSGVNLLSLVLFFWIAYLLGISDRAVAAAGVAIFCSRVAGKSLFVARELGGRDGE